MSNENPNVPIDVTNPDDTAFAAFGAARSVAGVRVTRKKSLGYPAFWRAVNLIAGDVAKIPLLTYKKTKGNIEESPDHVAYRLLAQDPNEYMTAFIFKQTMAAHMLVEGNGYAYIDRLGTGEPMELLVLDPERIEIYRKDRTIWYVYTPDNLEPVKIPHTDIVHFKGLGFDGLRGYPTLEYMADSLGTAIAARDYAGQHFRNAARPGGVLKHPGKLSTPARQTMRDSWERLHKGLDNAHKIAILEEGVDYVPFEASARNAQLLESRQFDAVEIANIFGVPSHKLGNSDKVAYNSLGEENQSYYDDTLSRWFKMISEECSKKLLSEKERRKNSHVIDFAYEEIQRADPVKKMDYATKGVSGQVLTVNEARAILGKNPAPDGSGDKFISKTPILDPQNGQNSGQNGANSGENQPKRGVSPALRQLIDDIGGRMVRRLTTHAERAAKSGKLGDWAAKCHEEHALVLSDAYKPIIALANERGLGGGLDPDTLAAFTIQQTIESIGVDASSDSISWATGRLIVPQITSMIADELGNPNE